MKEQKFNYRNIQGHERETVDIRYLCYLQGGGYLQSSSSRSGVVGICLQVVVSPLHVSISKLTHVANNLTELRVVYQTLQDFSRLQCPSLRLFDISGIENLHSDKSTGKFLKELRSKTICC